MAAHLVITAVTTAGGKMLRVVDSTAGNCYGFPVGTVATATPGADGSHYTLSLKHPLEQIDMPIGEITSIGGSAPAGNAIATDFASLLAVMP